MLLRADGARQHGITGRGVLVAMVDTGFYRHPFYAWHSYNYNATLAPDATDMEQDPYGHGTAEAANIFSCAPDVDFMGDEDRGLQRRTLAFKAASELATGGDDPTAGAMTLRGTPAAEFPEAA